MKQEVNAMMGWHELLQALEAFVNNYNGKYFQNLTQEYWKARLAL